MNTSGDYDAWGAYWGKGLQLYCLTTDAYWDESTEQDIPCSRHFYRAPDRQTAIAMARKEWPDLQLKISSGKPAVKTGPWRGAPVTFSHDAPATPLKLVMWLMCTNKWNTREALSRALGIDSSTVSRWLSGSGTLSADNILTIHETTGLSVDCIRRLSGVTRKEK